MSIMYGRLQVAKGRKPILFAIIDAVIMLPADGLLEFHLVSEPDELFLFLQKQLLRFLLRPFGRVVALSLGFALLVCFGEYLITDITPFFSLPKG